VGFLVDKVDEGQEEEALKAVQVQVIWRSVGREKHDDPLFNK
jgi:hypothetical protein